jgi:glucosyl-dolichyl phosphate glucuronosyltransferase
MTSGGQAHSERSPYLLTVAICTWNRAALLGQTLEQLVCLTIPPSVEWEVLVIDNNSTDTTPSVLAGFRDRLPLRALREPRQGKSYALNRAADEAGGHYILWTDDDVLVDPEWLAAYHAAFLRWPEAAIFGGYIEAAFAGSPPTWLPRVLAHRRAAGAYALRQLGEVPLALSEDVQPYGANMAVRRDLQVQFRYDPALGPRGAHYIQGEERAMVIAMLRAGHTGWYVPGARVRHVIPPAKQTTRHLRRYFRGFGETDGRRAKDVGGRKLFGKPLYMLREAVELEARYRWHRVTAAPEIWIDDLWRASRAWGCVHGFGRGVRMD